MAPGLDVVASVFEKISLPIDRTARLEQLCNSTDALVKKINKIENDPRPLLQLDHYRYVDGLRMLQGLGLNEMKCTYDVVFLSCACEFQD